MMLVAFWRWWKFLQHPSTKDNEKNLCQDLLTIENTDSGLKVHALHYANSQTSDSPLNWKFLQTRQTSRNNKTIRNHEKQILVMIKHCLRNSQINSILDRRVVFLLYSGLSLLYFREWHPVFPRIFAWLNTIQTIYFTFERIYIIRSHM